MAKATTYDEIIDADKDQEFQLVTGKIKKIFERTSGEGDYGEWSFQNISLALSGNTIKVTLKDREELPDSFEGKTVNIACGTKGHGVKAHDDEYKGKTNRVLWVTGSATIKKASAEESSSEEETSEAPPAKKKSSSSSSAEAPEGVHPLVQGGKNIRKLANLYILCVRESTAAIKAMAGDVEEVTSPGFLQSAVHTIFIAAEHRGYEELMPSGRILESESAKKKKAPPAEETEEKSAPRKKIDPDAPLPEGEEGNPY